MKTAVNSDKNQLQPLSAEVVDLRKTVTEKDQQLEIKTQQIEKKDQQIEQLLDYIQLLRQKQFGRSSEKVSKDQINLFDESELEHLLIEHDEGQPEATPSEQESSSQAPVKKQKPIRRPLPEHLKRIEKIIDVSDEEKSQMKDDWTLIGYETAEQLAVIPRQHYVIVTKRAKYAPNTENILGAEHGIITAARPEQILPKSIAHASVIADVITAKFVDGLPLYRQEKIYQRDGIELSQQTMSGWVIQLEEKLTPLMQA
ncbi:Mobile element protein [hydrothermal vent metagenome]|uniref:Mobile element protein n=1 Tax=hydrothermal vent metagenome TaxID=652676 RepID=A0A3B0X7B9_9ZZZZ